MIHAYLSRNNGVSVSRELLDGNFRLVDYLLGYNATQGILQCSPRSSPGYSIVIVNYFDKKSIFDLTANLADFGKW